jgi:hypothetical protein
LLVRWELLRAISTCRRRDSDADHEHRNGRSVETATIDRIAIRSNTNKLCDGEVPLAQKFGKIKLAATGIFGDAILTRLAELTAQQQVVGQRKLLAVVSLAIREKLK